MDGDVGCGRAEEEDEGRPARVLISGPAERSCLPSDRLHNKTRLLRKGWAGLVAIARERWESSSGNELWERLQGIASISRAKPAASESPRNDATRHGSIVIAT